MSRTSRRHPATLPGRFPAPRLWGCRMVWLAVWLVALLTACASAPEIQYYSLLLPGEGAAAATDSPGTQLVSIAPFRVDSPYGQDRLVYRQSSASPEVGFYHYHRWAASLAEQLAELTSAALADDFETLRFTTWRNSTDAVPSIRGRLLELAEVSLGGRVEVHARLELAVFDAAGERLARETLDTRASGAPETVADMVRLMRSALDQSLASATELRRALRSVANSG